MPQRLYRRLLRSNVLFAMSDEVQASCIRSEQFEFLGVPFRASNRDLLPCVSTLYVGTGKDISEQALRICHLASVGRQEQLGDEC